MSFKSKFSELQIGDKFLCNGTKYQKKSSRTAFLLENGAWFYFRAKEGVTFYVI